MKNVPLPELALFFALFFSLVYVMALVNKAKSAFTYAFLTALAWAWFSYLTH